MNAAFNSALVERRAVRQYTSQPVPETLVREILAEARWAPSASNTQCTYAYVLSGEPLARFRADLQEWSASDVPPAPDIEMGPVNAELYLARRDALFGARAGFVATEAAKSSNPGDVPWSPMVAGPAIFGAPVFIVLAIGRDYPTGFGLFDTGLLAQSVALAAHGRGLGTCIVASLIRYAELVRRQIPGTENKNFVIGIALGYPDWDAPVNRFPRERLALEEWVTFVK
ncbi:MAG: hypothetical protein A2133_07515 [Actinobacteria bacterium RBG_16_64_13]|nr:MAG: hypothetical protein A2133_07515 [Actinobacteria bacterium RBG_16_64_13]